MKAAKIIWQTLPMLPVFLLPFTGQYLMAQCSQNAIYGVTATGIIYPITVSGSTITIGTAISNAPSGATNANGMGYSVTNNKFYLFTEDGSSTTNQFSSYSPGLTPPTTGAFNSLSTSGPGTSQIPSGAVSTDGKSYYCIDANGVMYYYNLTSGSAWKTIASTFFDQYGNNITTTIQGESSGDMAFDANGNLWILVSSASKYGLYEYKAPVSTTPVSGGITLTQVIAPNTPTSTLDGSTIFGVAFNALGQMFLSTANNKLYLMSNATVTPALVGTMSVPGGALIKDLASCNLPVGVLPVSFVSFASKLDESKVRLEWTAIQQFNTSKYLVERSSDAQHWQNIGTLGSNYVTGKTSYTFTDQQPNAGTNFYRITEKDRNGQLFYSETRMIQVAYLNSAIESLKLWPNPSTDAMHVELNGCPEKEIQIYDGVGRTVVRLVAKTGSNTVDISAWPAGSYLILTKLNGMAHTQRFIKSP